MVLSTPTDIRVACTGEDAEASMLDATWEVCKFLAKNAPLGGTKAADFPRHKTVTSIASDFSVPLMLLMLLTVGVGGGVF